MLSASEQRDEIPTYTAQIVVRDDVAAWDEGQALCRSFAADFLRHSKFTLLSLLLTSDAPILCKSIFQVLKVRLVSVRYQKRRWQKLHAWRILWLV